MTKVGCDECNCVGTELGCVEIEGKADGFSSSFGNPAESDMPVSDMTSSMILSMS